MREKRKKRKKERKNEERERERERESVCVCVWSAKITSYPLPQVLMTDNMRRIQSAITTLMSSLMRELKTARPSLNIEELTLERGLFSSFDSYLRQQLDPVWNSLGQKTKQLVADMRTMRTLTEYLDQYDCVSFYQYIQTLRSGLNIYKQPSHWLLLDAADDLLAYARKRVYVERKVCQNFG